MGIEAVPEEPSEPNAVGLAAEALAALEEVQEETEVGYPFERPTLAAALRMRRLPVPGDGALPIDADLIHVPAARLQLRLRREEGERLAEGRAREAAAEEVLQWTQGSELEQLD